ncbi:pectin lyase-like protein [Microthyrium microscopicum]|uniref:Pectin lyase-like protein n=1 Tax=Microthyrium microscopicum TaxID=703497 RepID=A0A6A6U4F0_9PEZI|nr:pectin lyase-like protein [Microthyrium microscopicum]
MFLSTLVAILIISLVVADPIPQRGAVSEGPIGYGASTTGGGNGGGITVTSCSALSAAAGKGGNVIKIQGVLPGCGVIKVGGSTTIQGVGANSGLKDGGLIIKRVSNVIIRNIKFDTPTEKGDALSLDRATKVWIDHCEFKSKGKAVNKDYYDGLLDITHGCDQVTVSWSKFSDHWKGSLVGHSDKNSEEDTGKLHVTFHHNHWNNVNSRLPSIRFGTGHMFSSCFENTPTSGINARMGAQVLVEESHFRNVTLPIVTNLSSKVEGLATSKNNIFENGEARITKPAALSIPYKYTTDPAATICELLSAKAGVGHI